MTPRRILMTVDAVGGVWRYAVDAAKGLGRLGLEVVFLGSGPLPSEARWAEVAALSHVEPIWLDEPLDWMAEDESALNGFAERLNGLLPSLDVDILHLNMPSQVVGLRTNIPIVAMSHSCVVTWWQAVRGGDLPPEWTWKRRRNRRGFDAAYAVLAPSRSHAEALVEAYGPIDRLRVVYNASADEGDEASAKEPFVLAAARWWDEGKNGRVLDSAAQSCNWPLRMIGALEGPNGQRIDIRHAGAPGEMPGADVRRLMARASIFAAPSLYEPFGLVALEAAHAGAALVLSDIPVFRELWDGAAVFADLRDPAAFASAINDLAGDSGKRAALARRGQARAKEFSLERQAGELFEIYAGAMRGAASNAAARPLAAVE